MNTEQILAEIREANLSYLMLAQSLIRADREQALFRLGISEDTANVLGLLSPGRLRIEEDEIDVALREHAARMEGATRG